MVTNTGDMVNICTSHHYQDMLWAWPEPACHFFCVVQLQEPQQILAGPSKEGACQANTCKVSRSCLDLLMWGRKKRGSVAEYSFYVSCLFEEQRRFINNLISSMNSSSILYVSLLNQYVSSICLMHQAPNQIPCMWEHTCQWTWFWSGRYV